MSPEFFQVHCDLDREGPGSEATTLRALAACGSLPDKPRIIDFGCGPGQPTVTLARTLPGATVVGVDLHRPFLGQLEKRAAAAGVDDRVEAWHGSMLDHPGPADLIWSEGAAYSVGVEKALRRWHAIANPGARVAFSELVWLTDDVPGELRAMLEGEYPALGDVETTRKRAAAAGWHVMHDFILPASDWAAYYDPLRARVARLRKGPCSPALTDALDETIAEADLYDRHGIFYGYVFVTARKEMS